MRVAIVNWSRRRIGGVETYLGELVPQLARVGHEIGFYFENDQPIDREAIHLPGSIPCWSVAELGAGQATEALRAWRPDVIYVHKLHQPSVEARVVGLAPSVFFAHDYYGACISGLKTFKFPQPVPCHRRFGPACLALYFPRRCGGRSPFTMLRLYVLQTRRLALLRRYDALVTHSEHMRREYLRLGFPPERVHCISYTVDRPQPERAAPARRPRAAGGPSRLVFLGRMDPLKGGNYLIEALRLLAPTLDRPVEVTLAGDGPSRSSWERLARRVASKHPNLRIIFPGWLSTSQRAEVLNQADLFVMPSVWPEPFGRSGPEAGSQGVPAVAYAVGGITEWLRDGVNGFVAPGDPPTPAGLASALERFLRAPADVRARLRVGAVAEARRFAIEDHVAVLERIFATVARRVGP